MAQILNIDKNKKYLDILRIIRENGGRITAQRKKLIEIMIENPKATCKELFYIAHKTGETLGISTVYRTVKDMEKLGLSF